VENNTPIPDAELAELRRLHEAAEAEGGTQRELAVAMNNIYLAFPGLLASLERAEAERDHWRELLVSLDRDSLCDAHLGIGAEEYLAAWLAARDAQQLKAGAAKALNEFAGRMDTTWTWKQINHKLKKEAKRISEGEHD